MILDRALAAPGDEDHLLDPRFARLVDGILDQRPVDDGQHFLGDRLGGRKEPGAETGDGKDGFADRLHGGPLARSEEHTSELQSLMRISYAVFCLKKKKTTTKRQSNRHIHRNMT